MSQSIKNVDKKVGTGTNPKGNDDEIIKKIKSIEDRIQNNQKNATSTQIEDEIQEIKYEIQQLNDKMIDQMISSDYHPPLPIERNVKTEPIHAPIKLNELPTNIETIEENETNEFNEVQNTISHIYEFIEEENHILTSKIERKAENTLVERMFEKLRLMIAKVGEELNDQKKQINKKMGKNEAEKFFSERLKEFLAAGHGKACLVCGSKRINPVQTDIIIKKENI
ncbi:hypothetical protein GPJ56_008647 [Histomonas meleagridis]|uniref:uncharacterized protein n=1 Tax=Histomonas meleagridis TaxID=135588 RepID=UPI0035593BF7|nr:hypothetical protein GPJ56_008647 [Histomonas meleagridis]KAH0805777.1 hypothetical protein GO595_001416 [Histomonas meleagridis]